MNAGPQYQIVILRNTVLAIHLPALKINMWMTVAHVERIYSAHQVNVLREISNVNSAGLALSMSQVHVP